MPAKKSGLKKARGPPQPRVVLANPGEIEAKAKASKKRKSKNASSSDDEGTDEDDVDNEPPPKKTKAKPAPKPKPKSKPKPKPKSKPKSKAPPADDEDTDEDDDDDEPPPASKKAKAKPGPKPKPKSKDEPKPKPKAVSKPRSKARGGAAASGAVELYQPRLESRWFWQPNPYLHEGPPPPNDAMNEELALFQANRGPWPAWYIEWNEETRTWDWERGWQRDERNPDPNQKRTSNLGG